MTPTGSSETTTSRSERDRMSVLWESEKHLLQSDELRTFLCSAVLCAMETWGGSSSPKPRSIIAEVNAEGCCHNYVQMSGLAYMYCNVCGTRYYPNQLYDSHPVSPFAGGDIG